MDFDTQKATASLIEALGVFVKFNDTTDDGEQLANLSLANIRDLANHMLIVNGSPLAKQ